MERYSDKRLTRRDLLKGIIPLASLVALWSCTNSKDRSGGFGQNRLLATGTPEPTNSYEEIPRETGDRSVETERAKLILGDKWEVRVLGWEVLSNVLETANLEAMLRSEADPQNKLVAIDLVAHNISNELLDSEILGDQSNFYKFRLVDLNGRYLSSKYQTSTYIYLALGGIYQKPYLVDEKGLNYRLSNTIVYESYYIPPGFSIPLGVIARIDKNINEFGLVIEPLQTGIPNPSGVSIGQEENSGADLEKIVRFQDKISQLARIDSNAKLSSQTEAIIFERGIDGSKARFEFLGFSQPESSAQGDSRQYVELNVTNISDMGEPISFNVGTFNDDYQIFIYLNDGRVISALNPRRVVGARNGIWAPVEDLEVGVSKLLRIPVSSSERVSRFPKQKGNPAIEADNNEEFFGLVNLKDAILVLTDGTNWISWKSE